MSPTQSSIGGIDEPISVRVEQSMLKEYRPFPPFQPRNGRPPIRNPVNLFLENTSQALMTMSVMKYFHCSFGGSASILNCERSLTIEGASHTRFPL